MEEVLNYLKLKNQYYQKFHDVTKRFLRSSDENKWNDIEFFVDNRERILNIIRYFDHKIAELFNAPNIARVDLREYRDDVKALLDEREVLAKKIVDLDLELISAVDEMKSETITDLKKSLETRKGLKSFGVSAAETFTAPRKPTKTA